MARHISKALLAATEGIPAFCSISVSTSESRDIGPVISSILRSAGTISPSW